MIAAIKPAGPSAGALNAQVAIQARQSKDTKEVSEKLIESAEETPSPSKEGAGKLLAVG